MSSGNPNANEHIVWNFNVEKKGTFQVVAEFLEPDMNELRERGINIRIGHQDEVQSTISAGSIIDGKHICGEVKIETPGTVQLSLSIDKIIRDNPLYLKALKLKRL
jgi:hypothetical protein